MIPGSVVPAFLDKGEWSACFGESFLHVLLADLMGEGRCFQGGAYLREMAATGGIADGRNHVTQTFLARTEGEWLWFIDTDMGFTADTLEQLLAVADPVERPVVGALCFAQRRLRRTPLHGEVYGMVPTLYRWVDVGTEQGFAPMSTWERGEVLEVGATGAACLLIHRGALEAVHAKYGPVWFQQATHPSANPGGSPRTFSEDLSFCMRLAGAGVPVHVATAVHTTHHKGGTYLDLDAYERQGIDFGAGALAEEEIPA